ncbi:MAG: alginate export family protein [Bacteroidota bacterium]
MKKHFTRFFILVTLFLLNAGAVKSQFSISGEFRMRGEYRDGYSSLRDSSKIPYANVLGRARLLFDYKSEKITTRFSLYDAWVFGQNNYSSDTIAKNTVNIYEAFFKYNFTKGFALKVGRTELGYDDERFLGVSNWSMWGATHDIILAQWENSGSNYKGDFGFAVNNVAPASPYLQSYLLKNYKYMGFIWQQKKFMKDKITLSFLGLIDAFQRSSSSISIKRTDTLWVKDLEGKVIGWTLPPATTKTTEYPDDLYARVTLGLDGWLNLKKFSAFATFYYQGGHYKDGRKINSMFYAANLGYQVVKPLKLIVGYEHLSGNDFSDTTGLKTTVKGFSTLYGTSHRGYGYMDMFTTVVKDNLGTGLNDLWFRAAVTLNDKMSLEGTYRWFSIPFGFLSIKDTKNKTPYTSVKTSLGSEIDLMYVYKPIQNLELNVAYCFFMPSSTMEKVNNVAVGKSQFAQYAYIMVTYKPNFFTSEKK